MGGEDDLSAERISQLSGGGGGEVTTVAKVAKCDGCRHLGVKKKFQREERVVVPWPCVLSASI